MKNKKALLTLMLVGVFLVTLLGVHASAAGDVTVTATLTPPKLTASDAEQTVTVKISSAEPLEMCAVSYEIVPSWPNAVITSTAGVGDNAFTSGDIEPLEDGSNGIAVTWDTADAENISVQDFGTFNITVPASTPAGSYKVTVSELVIGKNYGIDTVYDGDLEATLVIEPAPVPVDSVTVSPETLALTIGEAGKLSAEVSPSDASDKEVTWTSSRPAVATVAADGTVTAVAEGTATITATAGGKSDTCTVTVTKPAVDSVAISQETLSLVIDETKPLTATVLPAAADQTVTWASSAPGIASVDQSGNVKGLAEGTATITATAGQKTDTCEVTVSKPPVSSVTVSPTTKSMYIGDTVSLTATVKPATADQTVTWSTSAAGVATVAEDGTVTAVGEGTADITATAGEKTATCAVTVSKPPVNSITLEPDKKSMVVGDTATLTATVLPETADQTVTWSTSAAGVATVATDGTVTAVAEGTATITAKAGTKSATCTVTVSAKPVPATGITLTPETLTLKVGETGTVTVAPEPLNTTEDVALSISPEGVATVDQNGNVTPVAPGTATITATVGNFSDTCVVTVAKGDQTITASDVTTTYGATNAKITASASGGGALTYTVTEGSDVIAVAADGKITVNNAGTATVKISAAENDNYNAAPDKEITVTVNPAKVNKPAKSSTQFTYNGKEQTYPIADNTAYTVEGNQQTNAGDYKVKITLNDKENYIWSDGKTDDLEYDFTIAKKDVTITANDKTAKVNDPVPELAADDYKVEGLVESEKLTKDPTVQYASDPDMTKAGTVEIVVSGAEASDNYNVVYVNGKLTIKEESSSDHSGSDNKITPAKAENGSVSVSPEKAKKGEKVTVTPKPDNGYELDTLKVTDKNGKEIPVKKNSDGTYSFTMPDGPVTVKATFRDANCPSKPYKDVDPTKWYHEAVDYAIANGLMNGVSSTAFAPDGTLSRAMLVTILYRLEGTPAAAGENPFDDVPEGTWYTDAVNWANANGIVKGFGDGTFLPDANITREQMAAIIYRYAQFKGYDVSKTTDISGYTDASSVSDWALDAMKWANASGLITGRSAKTLAPEGNTTRAEAAAILMRFIENTK